MEQERLTMSQMMRGNAVVGQSGGPSAVINQSMVGVVEGLRGQKCIEKILGAVHGVKGIKNDQYVELQDIPQDRLDRIAQTPSAALGSTRDKPKAEYCQEIFKSLEKRNARYFFYIGGNDSSDTCRIVNEMAHERGYEMKAFHVPKTIDNDLMHSDHTPGFPTAAKFVAHAFIGDNMDNRSLPGVKINIVMGRHAGFLTAASVLARQQPDDGPHLIYVPESVFNMDKFVADVDRIYTRLGRCLIAVSEGIHDDKGRAITEALAEQSSASLQRDAHGNIQLSGTGALGDFLSEKLKKELKPRHKDIRVRADTFGYLQRCFPGCVSETDSLEARMAGRKAAETAMTSDRKDGSIAIQRISSDPYRVEYKVIELRDVAAKTRTLDKGYIVDDNSISDRYQDYLKPLVGKLPVVDSIQLPKV
jgi:6-phosphofructokinase 1